MRIVLDGMGGDHAPEEIVKGAVAAAESIEDEIFIVGEPEAINAQLKKCKYKGDQISVVPAHDVITMHDSPVKAIRHKPDSSLVVGLNMVKDGKGDMFVSAGNTGALIVGSRLILGRIRGIDRPALASIYPDMTGGDPCMLVDAGASSESKARNLLEYGLMGSIYVEKVWGRNKPRVGLVNLGAEESKGTSVTKDAYQMLAASKLNFIGNVEGREVLLGGVDVVVCDGFSGNVLLKTIEGTAMFMGSLLKRMFKKNIFSKVGYLLCKSGVSDLMKMMDYREIGGTQFLGIKKPVIKAHGSSDTLAFRNAIRQAEEAAKADFSAELEESLKALAAAKEKTDD